MLNRIRIKKANKLFDVLKINHTFSIIGLLIKIKKIYLPEKGCLNPKNYHFRVLLSS